MSKNEKQRALVPRLRFPEFTEKWRLAEIGEVFASDEELEKATHFDNEKILTVKLHSNGVVRNERTGTLTGGANYFKRRAGQFIFSKIDLLNGAFGIVPEELDGFYSSSDVPAFSFSKDHSPAFFLNWLTANYRRLVIERMGTSATLKRVSPEKFRALPIPLPSPAEQKKIADCLGSLDDLIAAQGRKLAALREHKKGLMQQLFPREGETRPRLRFPEFQDAGEWSQGRCTDIATVKQGYGFPDQFQGSRSGKYPFYKVSDISHAVERGQQYISDANNYIDDEVLTELRAKPVPVGTIIFAKIGEAIRSNRRVATTKPAVIDNNVAGVKAKKGRTSDDFLFYLWSNVSLIDHAGGVMPAVSKSALENVPLTYPSRPEEQMRIADCLSSLDAMIAAQAEKLDALRTHKRGLMQQLFPSSEDVEV